MPAPDASAEAHQQLETHLAFARDLPPTWPVAFALAAAQTAAPVRECVLTCAFGWAENMAQAAIKAVPLGQAGGQRILARLLQAIPAAVDSATIALPDHQRQAFNPMLAILSAQHETQYSRLFRSDARPAAPDRSPRPTPATTRQPGHRHLTLAPHHTTTSRRNHTDKPVQQGDNPCPPPHPAR